MLHIMLDSTVLPHFTRSSPVLCRRHLVSQTTICEQCVLPSRTLFLFYFATLSLLTAINMFFTKPSISSVFDMHKDVNWRALFDPPHGVRGYICLFPSCLSALQFSITPFLGDVLHDIERHSTHRDTAVGAYQKRGTTAVVVVCVGNTIPGEPFTLRVYVRTNRLPRWYVCLSEARSR